MTDDDIFVPVRKVIVSEEVVNLKSFFVNEFNREPQFYVRVPGR